jgi:glyoxylase-like metal-dependent hydrolase (beta-lactamase superfamily II)
MLYVLVANLPWSIAASENTVQLLLPGYVKPIEGRELIPGVDEQNGGRLVASTIGLVRGQDVTVVVDPGFVADTSSLLQALQQSGVTREQVTHVFISHHHPDHTINAALFPQATVVDFWATYKGDMWQDHGDNYVIAPGITVLRTPGHTNEDASLVVQSNQGTVVFTHVWWFLSDGALVAPGPFPPVDPLAENQTQLDASRSRIQDLADCIVPGHGPPFPNPFKKGAICHVHHTKTN